MIEDNQITVFIVDDDAAIRSSLVYLIESVNLNVKTYDSAQAFLDNYQQKQRGCVLIDVRMSGMSGLELQQHLKQQQIMIPVIIITGHGDVPMAVKAMKAGAIDFIEKPFNDQVILDCINKAIEVDKQQQQQWAKKNRVLAKFKKITKREREVMVMVVQGKSNKTIAATMNVSAKTVEAHRAKVMDKMEAHSLPELVQMAILTGILPSDVQNQNEC